MEECRPRGSPVSTSSIARRAELDGARRRAGLAGELGRPRAELGEVEAARARRVRHGVPQRERPLEMRRAPLRGRRRSAASPRRLDRGERARLRCDLPPPSGAPAPRLAPRRCARARRRSGVAVLALAGQHRRVDGLREERVAETEAVRRLTRRRERRARPPGAATGARRAREVPRQPRGARIRRRRPTAEATRNRLWVRPSSRSTRWSRTSRRPRGSSSRWSLAAARSSSAKKGLPSERATIVSVSAAGSGESEWAASSVVSSSTFERPELEQKRRARATNTLREPAHALCGRGLVRAVGREQQNLLVADVVREEDEEVE